MNELLLRELVPAVIGVLVRRGADFASAEDAVQEALIRALEIWPDDPPRDPKAWLVAVAWHRFLDIARAEASRRGRELAVEAEPPAGRPKLLDPDEFEAALTAAVAIAAPGSRDPGRVCRAPRGTVP